MNRINPSDFNNLGTATPPPPPGVLPQISSRSQTPQPTAPPQLSSQAFNNNANALLAHLLNPPASNNTADGSVENGEAAESVELTDLNRFGLKGLVPLLRNGNDEKNSFALGTDLSILGLDITSRTNNVKISKTFASPWIETSRSEVEPAYLTPDYLKFENAPPVQSKLSLFSDETLFYIFYTKTKDILQEQAARELSVRNWRYHKDLQVWLTKEPTVEPIQISPSSERGVYVFFDPATWEKVKKEFVLSYHSIIQ